jgi:uncharacterized protein involved in exopolysaccharide biosynthesis
MRQRFEAIGDPDDESIDWQQTRERIRMVLRAPRRRPKLAALILVGATVLGILAAGRAKPTYEADAAVLIEKNVATPVLGDATKGVQTNDFDPGAEALEVVKGRENLMSLAKETHLFDKVDDLGADVADGSDKVRLLLKLLEARLTVKADGNVVRLSADWTDPQTAYEIVSAALRSFLDKRSAAEVSVIADAITMLEEHAQTERDGIDTAMNEFLRLKEGWKSGSSGTSTLSQGGGSRSLASGVGPNPDLARRLDEKKQQIRAMDDERRKQLVELKTQMAGLLGTYTPSHPAVVALQRKIEGIADEPSSMAALKNEERGLIAELAAQSGIRPDAPKGSPSVAATAGGSTTSGAVISAPTAQPRLGNGPSSRQDLEIADPASAMALSKLQSRIHKYEEFMDQITAAKLELDLARNAFRYRYAVHKPPELPTHARRPIRLWLGAGGLLLGIFLAFAVATMLDLMSGRLVEPWQVKRKLSLPVLGEVSPP